MTFKVISCIFLLSLVSSTVTEETDACKEYLKAIVNGFPNSAAWVMQMLDASAKLPAGILELNLVDLGSFDECIGIKQTFSSTEIRGKYCMVEVDLNPKLLQAKQARVIAILGTGKMSLLLGWCVPSICPITDFTSTLELFLNYTGLVDAVKPFVDGEAMCQTEETQKVEWFAGDWVIMAFLTFILAIIVASTAYDIYIHYTKQDAAHIILLAFSIKSNGKKLLAVSHNSDQLLCLHGIRLLSITWVILGHGLLSYSIQPVINLKDLLDFTNRLSSMYALGATVCVDSFLLLSGLLVCYMFLLAKEKGVKFNILLYYLHRYIRLTPALAIVVWIHATITPHFGSGPFWSMGINKLKDPCVRYWWSTLLYIQNYVNRDDMCLMQTWYLSVDTQLFFLSPLLLIPLWRYPRPTVYASIALVFGSFFSSFLVTWFYELPGIASPGADTTDFNSKYYIQTYARYGPWVIGLLLGYIIYKHKRNESSRLKLHPLIVILGWITTLAVLVTIVYAPYNIMTTYTNLEVSFFNGLHRQCWAVGLCWIIYACIFGYGGPINAFLSWSVFQVLGRFTYTMYLIHGSIILFNVLASRSSGYFTELGEFHAFWGDFFFTLLFSVCVTLAFESPIIIIEKVIFGTDKKKPKQELPTHHESTNNVAEEGVSNGGQTNKTFVSD